jgi:hypothetical protein
MGRFTIFLDGGFVKKKLEAKLGRFPTVGDVTGLCAAIQGRERLRDLDLLRIYYYDCPPY